MTLSQVVHHATSICGTTSLSSVVSDGVEFRKEGFETGKINTVSRLNEDEQRGKKVQHTDLEELANALQCLNLETDPWTKLCQMVLSDDLKEQYEGTKGFRMLLSVLGDIPIQEVINTGVVPRFVSFLDNSRTQSDPYLQFEAAWSITNIASGTPEQTAVVVNAGGIESLIDLLEFPNEEIREQGLWGLGNIAGDRAEFRDKILDHPGAVHKILECCKRSQKVTCTRTGIWAISNICRGKPRPKFELVKEVVPYLASIIFFSADAESLSDACWALDGIGESSAGISAIIQCGCVKKLVQLLDANISTVQRPALRVIGQLATGSATQTQTILTYGAVPQLVQLLSSSRKSIRRDACWTISNVSAGTTQQLQELIDNGAIPKLVEVYYTDDEQEVRKEASWAIANACTTLDLQQMDYFIRNDCCTPICDILRLEDLRIIDVVLDALHNILSYGGRKMAEMCLSTNPCVQLISNKDVVNSLLAVHSIAENSGSFGVWQKSAYILNSFFSGGITS